MPTRFKVGIGRTGGRVIAVGLLSLNVRARPRVFRDRQSHFGPAMLLKLDNTVKTVHLRSSPVSKVVIEERGWTLGCWRDRAGRYDLPGLGGWWIWAKCVSSDRLTAQSWLVARSSLLSRSR